MARAKRSAAEKASEYGDEVASIDWQPASSHRQAFKDEAARIEATGGAGASNPNNYNKRNSPGKKYDQQDRP